MLMEGSWIVEGDSVNFGSKFLWQLIASCRETVINCSNLVLFKPQSRHRLQGQIKLYFCGGCVWCFVQGKEESFLFQKGNKL